MKRSVPILALLCLCLQAPAQTVNNPAGAGGVARGTSLPATCRVGDLYFLTNATAGQQLRACIATNTWAIEQGQNASGDVAFPNKITITNTGTPANPPAGSLTCWSPSISPGELICKDPLGNISQTLVVPGSDGDLQMRNTGLLSASPINCTGGNCSTSGNFTAGTKVLDSGNGVTLLGAGAGTYVKADGSGYGTPTGSGTVNSSSVARALAYYAGTGTAVSPAPWWTLESTTNALKGDPGAPGAYTYFKFPNNTTIGGDVTAPFQFVNTNVNYTTYSDNVFEFGYNCNPGAAPVASHQVFCWTLESNYTPPAAAAQMEFYYTFVHPDGTGTRVFGITPQIGTGNHAILGQFTVTDMQFYDPSNVTTPFLDVFPGILAFNGTTYAKFNRNTGTAQTYIQTQSQAMLRQKTDESVTIGPDFPLGVGTNLYPSAGHASYTMPLNFGDRTFRWTSGVGFQFQDYGGTYHTVAGTDAAFPAGYAVYSVYRGSGSPSGVGAYAEIGNLQINNGYSDTSSIDVEMEGTYVAAARWTVMVPANNGSGNGNWYEVKPTYYSANAGYIVYLDARISGNVLYLRTRRGDTTGGGSASFYVTTHGLNSTGGTNTWTFTTGTGTGATVTGLWTGSLTPQFFAGGTTGAGSALLGANSPAVTNTAPYQWLPVLCSDGSACFVPAWK